MPTKTRTHGDQRTILFAGAIVGCIWFLLALWFDKGVRDFNIPVIPTHSLIATVASVLAGALTGCAIAVLYRRGLASRSRRVHFLLPLATLPSALILFSVLVWVVWFFLGERAGIVPADRFATILGQHLIYGLISPLFTPVLYGIALLSQLGFRRCVVRTA